MGVDRRRGQAEPAGGRIGGEVVAPGDDFALDDGGELVVAVGGVKWSRNRARCRAILSATSAERTLRTAASRYRPAQSSIASGTARPPIGSGTTFREGNLRRSGREPISLTWTVMSSDHRLPS